MSKTPKADQVRALREARADRRERIDTSDIPETSESWFKRAKLKRPGKKKGKRK